MSRAFNLDSYPGRPRILFVGLGESTHTMSWIDLLEQAHLNVRLFALPTGVPSPDWRIRTYVTARTPKQLDSSTRKRLSPSESRELAVRAVRRTRWGRRVSPRLAYGLESRLAEVIRTWRPHIIHTLGLDPAGYVYFDARQTFRLAGLGKWVLQLRGGSDLTLNRHDPELAPRIAAALGACDQLVSDNEENFRFARELGVGTDGITALGTVPGTGGVDVARIERSWPAPPSERRVVVCPKAYESTWSKVLPVFEALQIASGDLAGCEIRLFAMTPTDLAWYRTLPKELRDRVVVSDRVPRHEVLNTMLQARVMLSPSLIDGTPNSMWEAMAAGAFPIVSELATIRPFVQDGRNVLFARNLYPDEIAAALRRALRDNELVDRAAEENLELVRRVADRSQIAPRVIEFYERLARNGVGTESEG